MSAPPPSRADVDAWLSRVDDVSGAIHEILSEDPMEAELRRRAREAAAREAETNARRERTRMRYDPRYYARFENDDLIDRLLRDADDPDAAQRRLRTADGAPRTNAERVALDEALRLKSDAASAVRRGDWAAALALYDTALALRPPDAALRLALRNNRVLALLRLDRPLDAVAAAGAVLARDPHNAKARLRRAAALGRLRRPIDALADVAAVRVGDPTNAEAAALHRALRRAGDEQRDAAAFQREAPNAAEAVADAAARRGDAARALLVVRRWGRAAAAHFALHGGVSAVLAALQHPAGFGAAARLLAAVLAESAVAAAQLPESVADVSAAVATAACEGVDATAAAHLLAALAAHRPSEVFAACRPLLSTLLEAPSASTLFFVCELLHAWLRDDAVAAALAAEDAMRAAIPRAVRVALTSGLHETGLALALQASAANDAWGKAWQSLDFVRTLHALAVGSNDSSSLSPRAEEALYAVVYNAVVRAESRLQYVKQWQEVCKAREDVLTLRAWETLRQRAVKGSENAPFEGLAVSAKMMGVCTKFAAHDETLQRRMLEEKDTLWGLIQAALKVIQKMAKKKCEANSDDDTEDERLSVEVTAAWELMEHASTCAATFYSRKMLSAAESLSQPQRISNLLQLVHSACNDKHLVALGNAALLVSLVPHTSSHNFESCQAVDILIHALRDVRTLIFEQEHNAQKGTTKWIHAQSAQKNLAIAISSCCAAEPQRERLRELKGFETLYAVLNNNGQV